MRIKFVKFSDWLLSNDDGDWEIISGYSVNVPIFSRELVLLGVTRRQATKRARKWLNKHGLDFETKTRLLKFI